MPSAASLHRPHSDLTAPPGLRGCLATVKDALMFQLEPDAVGRSGLAPSSWPHLAALKGATSRHPEGSATSSGLRVWPACAAWSPLEALPQSPGCSRLPAARKGGSCPSPARHSEGKAACEQDRPASGACEGDTRCQPLIPTPLTALSPAFHPDTAPGVR